MSSELVYSTEKKINKKKEKNNNKSNYTPSKGPIKIRIEKKKRGGKTVTVLYDIPLSLKEAKALMKELQTHLACGATLKNSTIELRGDNKEKVEIYLKENPIKK